MGGNARISDEVKKRQTKRKQPKKRIAVLNFTKAKGKGPII